MTERVRGVCCPLPPALPADQAAARVEVLKALADPTRLRMLSILRAATEPVCICDLTAVFELSQPTVSHHMGKLRAAGLVEAERRGIWTYYRLRENLAAEARAVVEAVA